MGAREGGVERGVLEGHIDGTGSGVSGQGFYCTLEAWILMVFEAYLFRIVDIKTGKDF